MIRKGLAFTLTMVIALLTISVCPLLNGACAPGAHNSLKASAKPTKTLPPIAISDPVMEWNDIAATTVLSSVPSTLTSIQQTRVMAIVQVAMHDAVNGITGEFETYLSPPP